MRSSRQHERKVASGNTAVLQAPMLRRAPARASPGVKKRAFHDLLVVHLPSLLGADAELDDDYDPILLQLALSMSRSTYCALRGVCVSLRRFLIPPEQLCSIYTMVDDAFVWDGELAVRYLWFPLEMKEGQSRKAGKPLSISLDIPYDGVYYLTAYNPPKFGAKRAMNWLPHLIDGSKGFECAHWAAALLAIRTEIFLFGGRIQI